MSSKNELKMDATSHQDHIVGEGYHMENHTTIYSQHEMEINGVQLKERKESTTVTDDQKVNLGKTVIKHVRSIKGKADIWKQEDTGCSSMSCKKDINHQHSKHDLKDSTNQKEVPRSNIEYDYESVGEREDVELLGSDAEVTQTVTIYQRMVLTNDGEEEEGEQTVETELSGPEVTKFLEMWNKLWHPKVSGEQVQKMIDESLPDERELQKEDVKLNDVNRTETHSSLEDPIEKEGMTASAASRNTNSFPALRPKQRRWLGLVGQEEDVMTCIRSHPLEVACKTCYTAINLGDSEVIGESEPMQECIGSRMHQIKITCETCNWTINMDSESEKVYVM